LTSTLVGGEQSGSLLCRFTPEKRAPGTQWLGKLVGPRTCLDVVERRKILSLPELEIRTLSSPAGMQLLYRLHYPGTHNYDIFKINADSTINSKIKQKLKSSSLYSGLISVCSYAEGIENFRSNTMSQPRRMFDKNFVWKYVRTWSLEQFNFSSNWIPRNYWFMSLTLPAMATLCFIVHNGASQFLISVCHLHSGHVSLFTRCSTINMTGRLSLLGHCSTTIDRCKSRYFTWLNRPHSSW
jgi:hypothetical protein